MLEIKDLYDLDHTLAKDYLNKFQYPWEALKGIKDFVVELGKSLDPKEYTEVKENVWIHKTAKVFESAYLGSPCVIGKNSEVRHEISLTILPQTISNRCEPTEVHK